MPQASIQSFVDPTTFTVICVVADPPTHRTAIIHSVQTCQPFKSTCGRVKGIKGCKVIAEATAWVDGVATARGEVVAVQMLDNFGH